MARLVPLANRNEAAFEELAQKMGWKFTKRGWPDFFCVMPDGRIAVVEVKPRNPNGRLKPLKKEQIYVMLQLQRRGFVCFVSDGKTLEPFDREKHQESSRYSKKKRK